MVISERRGWGALRTAETASHRPAPNDDAKYISHSPVLEGRILHVSCTRRSKDHRRECLVELVESWTRTYPSWLGDDERE